MVAKAEAKAAWSPYQMTQVDQSLRAVDAATTLVPPAKAAGAVIKEGGRAAIRRSLAAKGRSAARGAATDLVQTRVPTGAGWTGDAGAAARYAQIVDADDVATLARHANVPENVVSSVKQHLFVTEHRLPVGPNQWRTGRFYPSSYIADLSKASARGERIDEFGKLLGHEYLESTLMKHMKLPYHSPHPNYWQLGSDGMWEPWPTAIHYAAHDLASRAVQGDFTPRQLQWWQHFWGEK